MFSLRRLRLYDVEFLTKQISYFSQKVTIKPAEIF